MNKFYYIFNMGGLGNQLFIYSYCHYLKYRKNVKVIIDNKTMFKNDSYLRKPILNKKFNEDFLEPSEILRIFILLVIRIYRFTSKRLNGYLNEDIEINFLNIFVYRSYFQTSKFYIKMGSKFLEKIDFSILKNKEYYKYKNIILNHPQSVCIHFRRNDYNNVLPIQYYNDAVNYYLQNISPKSLFICFSDNITWVKENFKGKANFIFVNVSESSELDEFYLMSICKDFIIANSTFSIWAAYFNLKSNPVVIAPVKNELYEKNKNIYFKNWILF